MRCLAPSLLSLVAGALGVCALQITTLPSDVIAASPPDSASVASGKRWVQIDLTTADPPGEIQVGKPVELSFAIGGWPR